MPDALMGASVSAERATFVRTPSRERKNVCIYSLGNEGYEIQKFVEQAKVKVKREKKRVLVPSHLPY